MCVCVCVYVFRVACQIGKSIRECGTLLRIKLHLERFPLAEVKTLFRYAGIITFLQLCAKSEYKIARGSRPTFRT